MTLRSIVVAFVFAVAAPAFAASDLTAQLDAVVAPHFPAGAPGAAVLVKKGDEVLLRKAYGLADVELAVPMKPDYIFRLGSVTKQFTAAAIMMLVDEGKLALGDDVRKYVPEYPKKTATVTIEHLLTHTGGVPNYTAQPALHKRGREDLTHEELLATFKDLPLEFVPGEKWSYSNSGYYLLGMVIEKVTKKPYVLCNSIPAPIDPEELAMRLGAVAIGQPLVEPEAVALAPAVLDRYVGVYKIDDKLRAVVRRDGARLTLQRTGGERLTLTPASETSFFVKDMLLRVSFLRDGAGRVSGFDVSVPGRQREHRARTDEPLRPSAPSSPSMPRCSTATSAATSSRQVLS